jgi:hypothetical protein
MKARQIRRLSQLASHRSGRRLRTDCPIRMKVCRPLQPSRAESTRAPLRCPCLGGCETRTTFDLSLDDHVLCAAGSLAMPITCGLRSRVAWGLRSAMNSLSRCAVPITANCTNPAKSSTGGQEWELSRLISPSSSGMQRVHALESSRTRNRHGKTLAQSAFLDHLLLTLETNANQSSGGRSARWPSVRLSSRQSPTRLAITKSLRGSRPTLISLTSV